MATSLPPPRDLRGRPLADLRISVTDRCNFRCGFCMPGDRHYQFLPKPQILSFEEVVRVAKILLELGVRKIRLTGGEPLLRAELETLIAALVELPGLTDLALTTNGYLLADKAASLRQAGLQRVTVSLHSLDPVRFTRLSGLGSELQAVLAGLQAASRAGLHPIKLNVVVIAGENDHEIVDLARFSRDHGYTLRLIEYMDVGTLNRWDPERVIGAQEMVRRIDRVFPLAPLGKSRPGEVAERHRYLDGSGEIGVIPSITQPFCGDCSRLRLSADGKLYTCLFASVGHDLKTLLRTGANDGELSDLVRSIWEQRLDRYSEERTTSLQLGHFAPSEKVEMFRIGG